MEEIVKETVITEGKEVNLVGNTSTQPEASSFQTAQYLIYFFFGGLDILLVFRLVLKLLGASTSSNFVELIYSVTGTFIAPFEGIFRSGYAPGVETTSVLEPATIVAILVYAIIAWGIVKLVQVLSGKQQTE
jgi:hypothetical protein